jgi:hypothetical protein
VTGGWLAHRLAANPEFGARFHLGAGKSAANTPIRSSGTLGGQKRTFQRWTFKTIRERKNYQIEMLGNVVGSWRLAGGMPRLFIQTHLGLPRALPKSRLSQLGRDVVHSPCCLGLAAIGNPIHRFGPAEWRKPVTTEMLDWRAISTELCTALAARCTRRCWSPHTWVPVSRRKEAPPDAPLVISLKWGGGKWSRRNRIHGGVEGNNSEPTLGSDTPGQVPNSLPFPCTKAEKKKKEGHVERPQCPESSKC